MARDNDPTECGEFTVKATTPDALLLVDDDENEVWVPRSMMDPCGGIDGESGVGDEGELIIPEWLAIEKELV